MFARQKYFLFFLLLLVTFMYYYWFKDHEWSKTKMYTTVGTLSFLVFLTILSGASRSDNIFNNPFAIVNEQGKFLFLAPDKVSEKVKPVSSGVKLKIIDENSEWYKVAAMNSEQGWIQKSEVRLLTF